MSDELMNEEIIIKNEEDVIDESLEEDVIDESLEEDVIDESLEEEFESIIDSDVIKEEVNKTLSDLKVNITEDDIKKYKKSKPKKDLPTPDEVNEMSDKEIIEKSSSEIKELYSEFSSFVQNKTGIIEDAGIKNTISTGIDLLDAVLGGGFAIGTMGMVVGFPGCGKSMLSMQTVGSGQLKYKGNLIAAYLDSEEATTTIRLSNLGVRYPKIRPYTNITIEKTFKFIEGLCSFKELKEIIDQPSIVVLDSLANTLSEKEREATDINSVIGYKSRLLSILIPKYISKLSHYNILFLVVNQLRDSIKIGPFQEAKELNFMRQGKTIPGGNTARFNTFQLVDMKVKSTLDKTKYGFDGIMCEIKLVKNKLFTPNIKTIIVGNFVTGFSNFWTNYVFLAENKRINTGAWNSLASYTSKKFRTVEAENLYNTDESFKEAFDREIEDCIKVEIKEKYNPDLGF
jgi:RecA/RadA recombinase